MLHRLDLALLRLLRTRGHGPRMDRVVLPYTHLGEHGLLWHAVAVTGALADAPRRDVFMRAVRVVLIAYVANIAVKHVVRRARPVLEGLPALSSTVSELSYPSAHSATSFAAAAALGEALPAVPLYVAATAMGLSRLYVGVHYPSDVLAGAAFGTAMGRLVP